MSPPLHRITSMLRNYRFHPIIHTCRDDDKTIYFLSVSKRRDVERVIITTVCMSRRFNRVTVIVVVVCTPQNEIDSSKRMYNITRFVGQYFLIFFFFLRIGDPS